MSTDVPRGCQLVNRERAVSSTGGVGTSGHLQAKLDPYLTPYIKINSKWSTDVNIRAKIIKILEENMGVSLHDLRLGNGLKYDTKGTRNKQTNKKMIFIPLKLITFMHQKSSREGKDNPQNWPKKKNFNPFI